MEEKIKSFLFAALFLISIGIVTIGILLIYNLSRKYKQSYLQTLLYQQIFLYSFFLYGVWGRIAIDRIFADLELNQVVLNKIHFLIPAIGMPFLIVSWYMLIKFFYEIKNIRITKLATYSYFLFYVGVIFAGIWFIRTETFLSIDAPDNFIMKMLGIINLCTSLFLIVPVIILKHKTKESYSIKFPVKMYLAYLTGVFIYSFGIWFSEVHYLVEGGTILLLFAISALIPVFVLLKIRTLPVDENLKKMDFGSFCKNYEISKRESEIILEICTGKSNQDIADSLFITLQTVKDHSHRIYTKTGVKNRVHLANLVRDMIKKE